MLWSSCSGRKCAAAIRVWSTSSGSRPAPPEAAFRASIPTRMSNVKGDYLSLAQNPKVQATLKNLGNNVPTPEAVKFSDFVVKINRKEKQQPRVILITDQHSLIERSRPSMNLEHP